MRGHPEHDLQKAIWEYLTWNKVFVWIDSQPPIGPKSGRFKMWHESSSGVSDILGIFHTYPLAIEVKVKAKTLPEHQEKFQERFRLEGGIAFRANSMEEVRDRLNAIARERGIEKRLP